jgi:DNA-binding LytR/AlgR family response regulator
MNKQTHQTDQTIKIPGVVKPIPIGLITHCKGYGNYTLIYRLGEKYPIVSSWTLKLFEKQLPSFLRANKSTLINHRHIMSIERLDGRSLEFMLANDAPVMVARRRVQGIRAKLAQLQNQQESTVSFARLA